MSKLERFRVFGDHEDGTMEQFNKLIKYSEYLALCADGHKGYGVPIGTVMANKDKIAPQGVGYDIGCGNNAVKLDTEGKDVDWERVKEEVSKSVSFGLGRNRTIKSDKYAQEFERFFEENQDDFKLLEGMVGKRDSDFLISKARDQFMTVGGGNHFIDIFVDENDNVWVGNHFGSRGFGHTIATMFMKAIGLDDSMDSEVKYIERGDILFNPYIRLTGLAQRYSALSRKCVCELVADIIGGNIVEHIENHHNAFWIESINGENYFVVRKGSTPISKDTKSFVGSSMLEPSYIVKGTEKATYDSCLMSTIHGAGRVLGRRKALGKRNKDGSWKVEPQIPIEEMKERIENSGVMVVGGGQDEDMMCYRRLSEVIPQQNGTIEIVETLYPKVVFMAGSDIKDPYKD